MPAEIHLPHRGGPQNRAKLRLTECRQPVNEEGEGFAAAATDGDGEAEGLGREASVEDVPPICSSLTPQDVATCDSKYWACPGANNLKVGGVQPQEPGGNSSSSFGQACITCSTVWTVFLVYSTFLVPVPLNAFVNHGTTCCDFMIQSTCSRPGVQLGEC